MKKIKAIFSLKLKTVNKTTKTDIRHHFRVFPVIIVLKNHMKVGIIHTDVTSIAKWRNRIKAESDSSSRETIHWWPFSCCFAGMSQLLPGGAERSRLGKGRGSGVPYCGLVEGVAGK